MALFTEIKYHKFLDTGASTAAVGAEGGTTSVPGSFDIFWPVFSKYYNLYNNESSFWIFIGRELFVIIKRTHK